MKLSKRKWWLILWKVTMTLHIFIFLITFCFYILEGYFDEAKVEFMKFLFVFFFFMTICFYILKGYFDKAKVTFMKFVFVFDLCLLFITANGYFIYAKIRYKLFEAILNSTSSEFYDTSKSILTHFSEC